MNCLESLTISKVHPHIGAEISGIDIRLPLPETVFAKIREAFDTHSVLVFREQPIDDDQQIAFSRRFGELEEISFGQLSAANKYVYHLTNADHRGRVLSSNAKKRTVLNVNSRWHTDSSFKTVPAMASILSGREIPREEKANTDFASMRAGYESLSQERRSELHDLVAVHHYAHSLKMTGAGGVPQAELDALPPREHPLVRIHPGTGKPSLFVSGHIESIVGMPQSTGRRLAEELVEWCTRPEFIYSHEWRPFDLVMWDNRCALHRAAVIPEREIRRAHRTTIVGDGAVKPYQ